jgi:hypothetical protein
VTRDRFHIPEANPSQYHPATIHWVASSSGSGEKVIGWIRLLYTQFVDVTVDKSNAMTIAMPSRGGTNIDFFFEVSQNALVLCSDEYFLQSQWSLRRLTIFIDTDAVFQSARINEEYDNNCIVRYRSKGVPDGDIVIFNITTQLTN